jgi:hypothetical protein
MRGYHYGRPRQRQYGYETPRRRRQQPTTRNMYISVSNGYRSGSSKQTQPPPQPKTKLINKKVSKKRTEKLIIY